MTTDGRTSDLATGSLARFQAQQRLLAMPEHQLLRELDSLDMSIWVFEQNYRELTITAGRLFAFDESVRLTGPNRIVFDMFMFQLTKCLHNFVASVASLVDHSRRLYRRHYLANRMFGEYDVEIKARFAECPLVQFVQGLRDYMLHFRLPGIALETDFGNWPVEHMEHRVTVSKKNLLECGFDWTGKANEFINSCAGKSIDVLEVADDYHKLVVDFYDWFASKQCEIHRNEYAAVSRAQEELLVHIGPEVPGLIAERLKLVRLGVTTLFVALGAYLTREQQVEIRHLLGEPAKWAEAAVERIQKHVSLTPELIAEITRLARLFPAITLQKTK